MANQTNTIETSIDEALRERSFSTEIWGGAQDQAIIPALTKNVPVIFGENSIPTITDRPSASMPGEGSGTGGSTFKMGAEKYSSHRAQVIVPVSNELLESDPASVMEQIKEEMMASLARQIDQAVLLGTVVKSGSAIRGVKFLNQATARTELTDGADYDAILEKVIGELLAAGVEPTAAMVDRQVLHKLATAKDKQGRRLHPEVNALASEVSLHGLHSIASRSISGRGEKHGTDNGVRAILGNFESVRFGFNTNFAFTAIAYGDPDGAGVDLQDREATAFKAVCRFGWGIPDLAQFHVLELPSGD